MPEKAFIVLGSNIEPQIYIPKAVQRLRTLGHLVAVSAVYETKAVGPPGQPDYHNAAIAIETDTPPLELRNQLRQIEADLGRVRTDDKYAPRTIDLDLVNYSNIKIQSRELTLPSADLLHEHVRVPLASIATAGEIAGFTDNLESDHSVREVYCLCWRRLVSNSSWPCYR